MKKLLMVALAIMMAGVVGDLSAQKKKTETVIFVTSIHCDNCKKRIEDNLPFEKGVKDVRVDVAAKTVEVDYDPARTDTAKLTAAIEKLGYSAEIVDSAQKAKGVIRTTR